MALAMFCFAIVDTIAKVLTDSFHPLQVVWMRQLGLAAGIIIYFLLKGTRDLKSSKPHLQIFRGIAAALSATLFIFGIAHVAITDAAAITFVAPLFVTILGATILGEAVGIRRWIAVCVGFLGTLVIVRPGFESFHPAHLLVFIAAFLFAVRQIISRYLSDSDKTATTVAYTSLVSFCILVDWLGQKSPIWDSHCTQNVRFRRMRTGISFTLSLADRLRLQAIVAAPRSLQKHVWRARIIL
jgi:drug/metabolite transporter (DMT)-like permease